MIATYLDASAIIYLVEGAALAQRRVANRIAAAERDPAGRIFTSQLARLECRVKPLRAGDTALLATTELRARYGFKTPDAIHLACAIVAGVDVFVTGDASLARCTEVPVEIVSPTP